MRLHFNWKLSLFVVICLPVVIWAGFWQLDRADQKREMQQQLSSLKALPAINYANLAPEQHQNYRNVNVAGKLIEKVFLLDNQIHKGKFGYELIQPLQLENKEVVLVSRGWIKGSLDRRILPEITTPQTQLVLQGYLYQPSENIQLDNVVAEAGWPKRVQSADVQKLYTALGKNDTMRSKFLLRLDKTSDAALASHWQPIRTGPQKHLGYAVQWFAMAILLVGLFIYASIVREKPNKP